ncbi:PIN domain-containing protein [Candidatus Woesearchaeota archaeon]|nr:PIN domain-containing protein [Candidatus Woesearchaeota archaeon]
MLELIKIYFFDTYALIEIYEGNKDYDKYKDKEFVTSYLNLIEFDFYLLKNEEDRNLFKRLKEFIVRIEDEDVKKANELKLKYKKEYISFIDCLGYIIAKRLGIKFLTGDNKFKDKENVEFVK